ncbi:DUF3263 domain-containing protein [Rhodococcus koreensis]
MSNTANEDAQILDYARRWLPYGGGTAGDLLIEFGLTPARYLNRLEAIIDGPESEHMDTEFRAQLHEFVTQKSKSIEPVRRRKPARYSDRLS